MHVAIHNVRDMELTVEVLGQHTSGLPFDADDLCLSVLFVEFNNFTKHGVANFRSDYGLCSRDGTDAIVDGKRTNCSGYNAAIDFNCSFSSLAFCGA
jgi:hypothetical protein